MTGTFTAEARDEAVRAGASPIDLIDGDGLCDLMKQFALGVQTTQHVIEIVTPEPEFLSQFEIE